LYKRCNLESSRSTAFDSSRDIKIGKACKNLRCTVSIAWIDVERNKNNVDKDIAIWPQGRLHCKSCILTAENNWGSQLKQLRRRMIIADDSLYRQIISCFCCLPFRLRVPFQVIWGKYETLWSRCSGRCLSCNQVTWNVNIFFWITHVSFPVFSTGRFLHPFPPPLSLSLSLSCSSIRLARRVADDRLTAIARNHNQDVYTWCTEYDRTIREIERVFVDL